MTKVSKLERMMGASKLSAEQIEESNKPLDKDVQHTPKSGPGQMLAFDRHMKDADKKVETLEAQLQKLTSNSTVSKIDPKLIHDSKWANRDAASFLSKEFRELKNEIDSSGGNVQPIKVRPKAGVDGEFEIVFGHRRHRACLELGLPVLALIEALDDKELFAHMDRENRQRADLRPYEQGVMYARALDEGLYPSMRKMAEAVGIEPGTASKAITLARLPREVIDAFISPLDLQFPWATALTQALQKNPDLVMSRAKVFPEETPRAASVVVFKTLIEDEGVSSGNTPREKPVFIKGKGGQTGNIVFNPKKKLYEISLSGVDKDRLSDIKKAIYDLLS